MTTFKDNILVIKGVVFLSILRLNTVKDFTVTQTVINMLNRNYS